MLRFSHFEVPVGQVPSTGKALTGRRSPFPSIITAVTRLTKSGASAGTIGGAQVGAVTRGHRDFLEGRQGAVDGGEVPMQHRLAALAVRLLDRFLDLGDRLLAGRTRRARRSRSA